MLTYSATIQGITPLLMNRPSEELIAETSKERKTGNETPQTKADAKLYSRDGVIYQPATHLQGCLVEAGKNLKVMGKGTARATYSKIAGYAIEVNPFEMEHKKTKWEIFSVLAVNPTTKGRNMLHRPMFREWELDFEVTFDDTEISQEIVKQLLDIGGRIVGIGDWRPAKKGRFGKFQVTKWDGKSV